MIRMAYIYTTLRDVTVENARTAMGSAENDRTEAADRRHHLDALEAEVEGLERKREATRAVLAGAAAGSRGTATFPRHGLEQGLP